jgi:WXXGXW repeat (2 copies)
MIRKTAICSLFFAFLVLAISAPAFGQVAVSVTIAPPALPVYDQPVCPSDGYIWTPGYWAWDDENADYYWVPGTWVEPPTVGFFWTPGYWAWGGDAFMFHVGYWGPEVGFYGGINYGFGYFGDGYAGGRWDGGHFFYNRSVNNVNVTVVHNVYNERVNVNNENRVSFNGGNGGISARPTAQQEAAERGNHVGPVAAQNQQMQTARGNRDLRASVNHGKPPIAATPRAGAFDDHAVKAKEAGAPYTALTKNSAENARATNNAENQARERENNHANNNATKPAVHPKDLPAAERAAAPNTGNAKTDQKYQQQQDKLYAQQGKERQKLQQKQDQEHQKLTKQNANDQRNQQVEQKHQQQTQQLVQKHVQQQRNLAQRQQAPSAAHAQAQRAPGGESMEPRKP